MCDTCDDKGYFMDGCPTCSGSGEGMYDGSTCYACKGIGEVKIECLCEPEGFTDELCETCPHSCEDTGDCKIPKHLVCHAKRDGKPF